MQYREVRGCVITIILSLVVGGSAAVVTAQEAVADADTGAASENPPTGIPAWAQEARWYHVVVPRYHNLEKSNDPPGTRPWTAQWPVAGSMKSAEVSELDSRAYGGDLQGLRARLPYLKELGVNVLYVTHLFRGSVAGGHDKLDFRHIDDTVGVTGSLVKVTGETDDPTTWKFSASDRVFLDLIKDAHRHGLLIAVRMPPAKDTPETLLAHLARRWMDPDGDGDPSDGIDAWVVGKPQEVSHDSWKRWRTQAKKVNAGVLLVVDVDVDPAPWLDGNEFDVAIDYAAGAAIRRFFSVGDTKYTARQFLGDIVTWGTRGDVDAQFATPIAMGSAMGDRWLSALSNPAGRMTDRPAGTSSGSLPGLTEDAWRRACVALVFAYVLPGSPMTFYGDEVGMVGGSGPLAREPMWWNDLGDSGLKPGMYRGDLASLTQWLNVRRGMEVPLLRGGLRPVLLDESRQLLALSRKLPGNEVILVVNYGDTKHRVTMPVGEPGRMVGILSPQFGRFSQAKRRAPQSPGEPGKTLIRPLRVGGSRQYVDAGGHIRFWIDPMAVRLILVRQPG